MELTQAEYNALPLCDVRTYVDGLKLICVHRNLSRQPVSIVDEGGHYRLGRRQWELATRAASLADDYSGKLDGSLAELLRAITGVSTADVCSMVSSEPSSEDLPGDTVPAEDIRRDTHRQNNTRSNTQKNSKNTKNTAPDRGADPHDVLGSLADRLAAEALSDLQTLTERAIRTQFERRREEIVRLALDALD